MDYEVKNVRVIKRKQYMYCWKILNYVFWKKAYINIGIINLQYKKA